MSLECSECEHDLRGGHDESCSRYREVKHAPGCVPGINEDYDCSCGADERERERVPVKSSKHGSQRMRVPRAVFHEVGCGTLKGLAMDSDCTCGATARTRAERGLADAGSSTSDTLRAAGWTVAVHNDYRQNGVPKTFWLLTHPDGTYVKGEGESDVQALAEVQAELSARKHKHDDGAALFRALDLLSDVLDALNPPPPGILMTQPYGSRARQLLAERLPGLLKDATASRDAYATKVRATHD